MKMPFIPYSTRERAYRKFLRDYTGRSAADIRRQAKEDSEFLTYEKTYTELEEIFMAGWDACECEVSRCT